MILNMTGGGSPFKATINATYPSGSTCTATCGSIKYTAAGTSGSASFNVKNAGTWTISCTNGTDTASQTVSITVAGQIASVTLVYNQIPSFTYSGSYKIVNDSGIAISSTKDNNWNIQFLTSGTLVLKALNGLSNGGQVFLVGGGGGGSSFANEQNWVNEAFWGSGGGGGGYTKTSTIASFPLNTGINVTVGAGGNVGAAGGTSSMVVSSTTYSAAGGASSGSSAGGAGGSGGGAGSWSQIQGMAGGTNGGDGTAHVNSPYDINLAGGKGQGTTTRPFGGSTGYIYSEGGGGGGGRNYNLSWTGAAQGSGGGRGDNTGDGGKGFSPSDSSNGTPVPATKGCSGIVILRSKR